jgi:5-methylcytosine-specific restriction enzyme subunit McrC
VEIWPRGGAMSEARQVALTEGERTPVPDGLAAAARELGDGWARRLGLERGWDGAWSAWPARLVGVLPLGDGWVVRIQPKLPVASVAAMLAEVYDLPSLRLHREGPAVGEADALLDPLAQVFARRVLVRSRRGLLRRYVEEEDELAAVRGRIDVPASLRLGVRGRPALRCRYQELTCDVGDNQILLAALVLLARSRALSAPTRAQVEEATRLLAVDITLRPVRPAECLGRDYDRLNIDYRELHHLARFFLAHLSSDLGDQAAGAPFTLDMAHLFERFVAGRLRAALPDHLRLLEHPRLDLADDDDRSNPDLVIKDRAGGPVAVLDTKYKDGGKLARSDLHQIVFYATALRCRVAGLVYPHALGDPALRVGDVVVHKLGFDLTATPGTAARDLARAISDCTGGGRSEDRLCLEAVTDEGQ